VPPQKLTASPVESTPVMTAQSLPPAPPVSRSAEEQPSSPPVALAETPASPVKVTASQAPIDLSRVLEDSGLVMIETHGGAAPAEAAPTTTQMPAGRRRPPTTAPIGPEPLVQIETQK
jgi:hypothetical protein